MQQMDNLQPMSDANQLKGLIIVNCSHLECRSHIKEKNKSFASVFLNSKQSANFVENSEKRLTIRRDRVVSVSGSETDLATFTKLD